MFLVQLWFDTFMLHESEFKLIVGVYKTLRQEGVVFPLRDANNQFLISFDGKKSPIFETIEAGHIYEEPSKTLKRRAYRVPPTMHANDIFVADRESFNVSPPNPLAADDLPRVVASYGISTEELDSMMELMAGVLTDPKQFILEDGTLTRRAVEGAARESAPASGRSREESRRRGN